MNIATALMKFLLLGILIVSFAVSVINRLGLL